MYSLCRKACSLTRFCHVGPAFVDNVLFICKPLDAFPQSIHVRILEDVHQHDNLVVANDG